MQTQLWSIVSFALYSTVLGIEDSLSTKCHNCCDLPKTFDNGKIYPRFKADISVVEEGTTLTFKCRPKFELQGKKINICRFGRWLPEIPKCVPKSCQPPPLLDNGEPILEFNVRNFPLDTVMKYKCDFGYELIGGDELVCTKSGNNLIWSGERPACTAVQQCSDPGVSSDGYRLGECCNKGSILWYNCNEGFTMIGTSTLQCLGDVWNDKRPLCQPDDFCPEPPAIPNGKVIGSKIGDFYRTDDTLNIECDKGYAIEDGSDYLYCEDGQWDEEFPFCSVIKCSLPELPENGTIHEIDQRYFKYESEVHFVCEEGFLLVGNSWTSCGELGWNNPSPICQKIKCPIPPLPENGWMNGDSHEVGDEVEFKCFSGYQLLGSSNRKCLPNGKWSGELTRCDSKDNDCPNPGIPINGLKVGLSYKVGSIVKFSCLPGKQLIGSPERLCQKDGEWSGSEVFCLDEKDFDQKESVSSRLQEIIDVEKDEQEALLNEYEESKANYSSGNDSFSDLSRAINLNHPNRLIFYFVFDISGSIGEENFRKSINFIKLLVKEIGVSQDKSRVGAMTFSDKATIVFYPVDYITTESVINALDEIEYKKGGGTATRKALQLLKKRMIPLTEDALRGNQKPIVFLLTDGKANMEGDPLEDANELKNYGVEIYCIGITGDRNMKTLYEIATTKEEHVFILDSYDTIDWLVQEILNGSVDYSVNCGIQKRVIADKSNNTDNRGRVIGGDRALKPWPWMAALYFARDNDVSKAEHRCGGSLIDKTWVLTAAHCFYDLNGNKIPTENIIVNLGLLNVKKRSNLQQFPLEKYIIHEEYERKTHHNDIALVKLSREAEYNLFVRPICLPPSELPQDTKFYRDGERAVAIGWGYDKSVKKGGEAGNPIDHLKRLALPLQNSITCSNSLNNSYHFTDSMFCAGRGNGKEDTCKGDSGGPLMQSMVNDLGQTYWTQVGIVSWGVGCAQKGTYGFYTHVSKLKEWIEANKK